MFEEEEKDRAKLLIETYGMKHILHTFDLNNAKVILILDELGYIDLDTFDE